MLALGLSAMWGVRSLSAISGRALRSLSGLLLGLAGVEILLRN